MNSFSVIELPYNPQSEILLGAIRHLPWPIFLDSHTNYPDHNVDILTAAPSCTLTLDNGQLTIEENGHSIHAAGIDPFAFIQEKLDEYDASSLDSPYPVAGWFGLLSYDFYRSLEEVSEKIARDIDIPEVALGFYEWVLINDHKNKRCLVISVSKLTSKIQNLVAKLQSGMITQPKPEERNCPFSLRTPFRANMDSAKYQQSFQTIKDYILAGDCYQVNFAQRFEAVYEGDPWEAYRLLRKNNPAPMSAFFDIGKAQILSLSPERFLQLKGKQVVTRPIKGTRARCKDHLEDRKTRQQLENSEKDKAENLMIVDLLRNDLGKVCEFGTLQVPSLFALETYPNVHHLVSTVSGTLKHGENATSLLRACFPGGSITGAPKVRAMEIIEELEPHRRSVYCGAIAYFSVNGLADSNIAIRTVVASENRLYCWGGGGLVADSVWQSEYQETFDKVGNLFEILESTLG